MWTVGLISGRLEYLSRRLAVNKSEQLEELREWTSCGRAYIRQQGRNVLTSIKISHTPNGHSEHFPFNADTEVNEIAVCHTEYGEYSLSHRHGRAKDFER